ncbi:MAG: transposase [Acidobacteria bacterium]|nr:transposase [Acidobacteriota bacterium]
MQAYSLDLRQRVVRAYEQGYDSIATVAERFSVSVGFVKKMLSLSRTTGELAPRGHGGGRRASLTPKQRQLLGRQVRVQNDISLAELQTILEEQEGVSVHVSTICRALAQLDLPHKKRALPRRNATTTREPGSGGVLRK